MTDISKEQYLSYERGNASALTKVKGDGLKALFAFAKMQTESEKQILC
jgi:hypothetical protein